MYDVIVVGAGPAGCTAAKALAEKGYKVLLVEKFKMPRYKSCSGVLIKKSMELVKKYFGEAVPESAMCTPTDNRGMVFTNDAGKEYRFEQEGLNVWRSHFDGWLAEKAKESGAEVRDGVAVLSCTEKDGFVEVSLHGQKNYTEGARYVIDCEGVVGALKRKITGEVPGYITTYQTFNEGSIDLDPHYFYAYLQPELSEYSNDSRLSDAFPNSLRHNVQYHAAARKDTPVQKINLYSVTQYFYRLWPHSGNGLPMPLD